MSAPPLSLRIYQILKRPFIPYRNAIKHLWNCGQRWVAGAVRCLILSSDEFPRGFRGSTRQWQEAIRFDLSTSEYAQIDEPSLIQYTLPRESEETLHWRFSREASHNAPATFCAAIPRGRVWGPGGAVISSDNRLLADLSRELTVYPWIGREHSMFRQFKLPEMKFIKGTAAILAATGGNNYFHWMFDVLPRLGLLRAAFPTKKVDMFLVNNPSAPFQVETLRKLGISRSEVFACNISTFVEIEELLAPSLPGFSGHISRRSCDFLRNHFGAPDSESKSIRRLYIGRQNSIYRRVIDEGRLVITLQEYGFEALDLEKMTVADQAAAFSQAEVVVGPHGAGLTNLVFCRPGTKVVEIFSPQYVNPCYWTLASQMKLEYSYVLGLGNRPPKNFNPEWGEANIQIDYHSLSGKLKMAGIDRI